MKDLLCEVQASEFMEYQRAATKFGKANNSPHESAAVIREEKEEAREQCNSFDALYERYWEAVKANAISSQGMLLANMREVAERAAAEWIQTAAMCYKATIPKEEQP